MVAPIVRPKPTPDVRDPVERVLLLLSTPFPGVDDIEESRGLLATHRSRFDWGRLIDLAARHKVLALVGRNLVTRGAGRTADGGSLVPYRQVFVSAYRGNRDRNLALFDEYGRVIRALGGAGVRFAVRKGPALVEHLYHDLGARQLNDLDLLVPRSDVPELTALLERLGYRQGRQAADRTAVEPFARRTQLYWRTHVNNSLPFVRLSERDDIERYTIDLCHDVFQHRSPAAAPVDQLLDRAIPVPVCGEPAWILAPEDELLDLCAHLHKEATSFYYLDKGKGLQVKKFLDVVLAAGRLDQSGWERFVARVVSSQARTEAHYALHHTTLVYPGGVPEQVLTRISPGDIGYVDEYGGYEGKPERWSDPFLVRLFSTGRDSSGRTASTVPLA